VGGTTDIGALLQALPLPMWVYDPETLRILAVNDEAVTRYGWTAEEFTSLTIADLAPAADRRRLTAESAAGTPRRGAGVWRHQNRDGTEIDVVIRTSPLQYAGQPARLAIVQAMSSPREMSELAARAEAIVNSSADAIMSLTLDGLVTGWNPAAERIYGYSEAEMLGQSLDRLGRDDQRNEIRGITEQVSAGERLVSMETERVRADGTNILVSLAVFPVFDATGKLVGLSGISRDITEQRRSAERDRAIAQLNAKALSDASLAEILDTAARLVESVLTAEVTSVFEIVPGADELLLVAGGGWAKVRIGATRVPAGPGSLFGGALASSSSTVVRFTFDPSDPSRPPRPEEPATRPTLVAPVRIEGGCWGAVAAHLGAPREPTAAERTFVEGIATAVGAAVARAQRETIRQRSEELSRLAAVGQLAAGVCHDFNNVLTVVQLAVERLRTTETLSSSGRDQVDLVRSQVEHGSSLIWQILDFARARPFDARVVDIGSFVEALGGMVSAVVGPHVTVSVRTGRGPLAVNGDPVRLQQILMNLVSNARDAMGGTGTLLVAASRRLVTSLERGLPPGLEAGAWICLEVSDTGSGMPDEVKARAFDPFFTTKGPGSGTGLGLAQVASLVAQHDGHVGISSSPGRGTTVTIWLPPYGEDGDREESA
jgi:two-component system cell cycle sensor histidine kinase/response regulator CckA